MKKSTSIACPYCAMVDCPLDNRKCAVCGWKPEVEKMRKLILRAHGVRALQKPRE